VNRIKPMAKTQTAPEMKPEGAECEAGERFQKSDTGPISVRSMVKIDDDFHGWLLAQAAALRQQHHFLLDWQHLAEELEAMAARDRRELKERLKNLLLHLLKLKFQPGELHRHHSWRSSVREAREQISDILEDSPGIFQGKRDAVLASAYSRARDKAADDSGLAIDLFPVECPWSFDQIMQHDFFPGTPRDS